MKDRTNDSVPKTQLGTALYAAPEIVMCEPGQVGGDTIGLHASSKPCRVLQSSLLAARSLRCTYLLAAAWNWFHVC
jgi:hypothetical protein